MSRILLHHGSSRVIKTPQIRAGNIYNDYGQGFYCTTELELAKEWSCRIGGNSFVNNYHLDSGNLKILDLTSDNYSVLHWITILLENRKLAVYNDIMQLSVEYLKANYHLDLSKYDVVIGYRADDSYFSYARDFVSNALTIESLNKAIHLGDLGIQFFLRSKKAFNKLTFLDYEEVDFNVYHPRSILREKKVRNNYDKLRQIQGFKGTFISNIMENGV